jgi:hypothetical protein
MKSKPLRNYACVYVNILILSNATFNENGKRKKGNLACIKIGECRREDLDKRFKEHKTNYSALISIPLLEFETNNSFELEGNIKKELLKYNISVQCSGIKGSIPNEFYTVNEKIINKLKTYANTYSDENMVLTNENKEYGKYDDLCEYLWDLWDTYELNTNLTILTSKSDSLTLDQIRIMRNYSIDDVCVKLGNITAATVTE